ncbi:hypothetical protein TU70_26665 [Bacillus mycoides]|nr:hypothetical protein TU70_26665 [Bacillus mycoides]
MSEPRVSVVVVSWKKNKTSFTIIEVQINNWYQSIHSGAFILFVGFSTFSSNISFGKEWYK